MEEIPESKKGLTVVAAAVRDASGKVWTLPPPARHCNVIWLMRDQGIQDGHENETQGFLLSDGRFCRRKPAKVIARRAGQLLERASKSSDLFSEDVW